MSSAASGIRLIKVVKGEIHNLLSLMREDPKYVSTLRFSVDLASKSSSSSFEAGEHPLLTSLRQLNEYLSNASNNLEHHIATTLFLAPFCAAVSSRDISATVTGAALGALHKFILYGFISDLEGITLIARAIRHCSFEEGSGQLASIRKVRNSTYTETFKQKTWLSGATRDSLPHSFTSFITDEQVVLKLISLSSIVVRSNVGRQCLDSHDIVGIFETALHVALCDSVKANSLLQSAADDCLAVIVLVVFRNMKPQKGKLVHDDSSSLSFTHDMDHDSNSKDSDDLWGDMDPSEHLNNHDTSLDAKASIANGELDNDLLKATALLPTPSPNQQRHHPTTTSPLLTILSRIVSMCNPTTSQVERCILGLQLVNIALETADPFQLMQHSELLHVLQNDLCKHLLLLSTTTDLVVMTQTLRVIFNLSISIKNHLKIQLEVFLTSVHLRILDPRRIGAFSNEQREIALESLIEFCCEPELMMNLFLNYDCDVNCSNLFSSICKILINISNDCVPTTDDVIELLQIAENYLTVVNPKPLHTLNKLATHGLIAIVESIAKRCPVHSKISLLLSSTEYDVECQSAENALNHIGISSPILSDESSHQRSAKLVHNKLYKERLISIADQFNRKPQGKEWIQMAQDWDMLPTSLSAKAVATILFTVPFVDKVQLGLYLSKGPPEKYPFHTAVRLDFAALYDFMNLSFTDALRLYLQKFRLPGEAQCIDRLMEAFARQYYKACCEKAESENNLLETAVNSESVATKYENSGADKIHLPFKSADAVYILSFSTIMLNTDLHNVTIPSNRRMTMEQFVRNNRGTNDGEDFPQSFLVDLYNDIKTHEIQIQKPIELDQVLLNDLFQQSDISAPMFTSYIDSSSTLAGVHERDMYVSIMNEVFPSLFIIFVRSRDDFFSTKVLRGIKDMAMISVYFSIQGTFDKILMALLSYSHHFILNTMTENVKDESDRRIQYTLSSEMAVLDRDSLSTELLCLELALHLSHMCPYMINESWPLLVDLVLALRDLNSLPSHMCELEDFGDNKKPLPLSEHCDEAHFHANLYLSQTFDSDNSKQASGIVGSFSSLLLRSRDSQVAKKGGAASWTSPIVSSEQSALLSIIATSHLEQLLIGKQSTEVVNYSFSALLNVASLYDDYKANGCAEMFQFHAVFAIELAARSLFSNREHASTLYPKMHVKFEAVINDSMINAPPDGYPRHPYLVERVIVTILRSCIHMLDIESLRDILCASLRLLTTLPISFVNNISNRMGCALGILLRGYITTLNKTADWIIISDLLDRTCRTCCETASRFIFDGVASCVTEYIECYQGTVLCPDSSLMLLSLLINFVDGTYGLIPYQGEALALLEKVYIYVTVSDDATTTISSIRDSRWLKVGQVVHRNIFHEDSRVAKRALDFLQTILFESRGQETPEISPDTWLSMLDQLTSRFPPVSNQALRIKAFECLCSILLCIVPSLNKLVTDDEALSDFVRGVAKYGRENLRAGRKGSVTPLFETTLEQLTNVINVLTLPVSTNVDDTFSIWCAERMYFELEQVGAGGSLYMTLQARGRLQ